MRSSGGPDARPGRSSPRPPGRSPPPSSAVRPPAPGRTVGPARARSSGWRASSPVRRLRRTSRHDGDLVFRDPAGGGSRVQGLGGHPGGEPGLGGEGRTVGGAGAPASCRALGPRARDVQGTVDGGVSAGGGVYEVDGDPGVLDAAGRAGAPALNANGRGALLQAAGLVDHEHGVGVVQVLDHVGAYVVTDRVGVRRIQYFGGTGTHVGRSYEDPADPAAASRFISAATASGARADGVMGDAVEAWR